MICLFLSFNVEDIVNLLLWLIQKEDRISCNNEK